MATSIRVAVNGIPQPEGIACSIDAVTGLITFEIGHVPNVGDIITAGYSFDVPARFDTDRLEISLAGCAAGTIPSIPIVEVRE